MIKIKKGNIKIEVTENIPELYEALADVTNPILQKLKHGLSTWIQNDIRANAFSVYENGRNYIVLTVGLCKVFWDEIEEFIRQSNFEKVFTLSDEKKILISICYICIY